MADYRRPLALAAAGVVLLLIASAIVGRLSRTEEDRVRDAIRACATGAEEGSVSDTVAPVSASYRDRSGWSRDDLKGFLFMEFQRRGGLSVLLSPIEVDIDSAGDRAEARFKAAIAEGVDLKNLRVVPKNAEIFNFRVSLHQEGGDWKVVSHERSRVRDAAGLLDR